MGRLISLVIVVFLTSQFEAKAVDFNLLNHNDRSILLIEGEIKAGDGDKLLKLLSNGPKPFSVWLNSIGGVLVEGMQLGFVLRDFALATHVPNNAECTSACVFVLAGGVVRSADYGSKVGVHNASRMSSDEYINALRDILIMDGATIDTKLQLIVSFNEQFAAQVMSLQANYLQRVGVSLGVLFPTADTHHLQVYYLTQSEMRKYNLTNAD